MTHISVCCPTFNSERTVGRTLESVAGIADEIIVVDSYSTDKTIEIVKRYTDKIYCREYKYHGLQMNYAIDLCSHDWVFCIDSDEWMDEEMIGHLGKLKEDGLDGNEAFRLKREWFFMGRIVHAFYPVSSPDRIVRFFDRRTVRFNERPVHDKPVGFRTEARLQGRLMHDSIASLHDLFDKMNKYTTRHALGNVKDAPGVGPLNLVFNPPASFVKWYFFKKNFLDGFRGFVLGSYAFMYTFLKYAKLYALKMGYGDNK